MTDDEERDAFVERLTARLDRAAAGAEPSDSADELNGIVAALASPAAWSEPPDLRAAVLQQVRTSAASPMSPAVEQAPLAKVIPLRPRWQRLAVAVPVAAAAAAILTLSVLGVQRALTPGPDEVFTALGASGLQAEVSVTSKPSGFEITLDSEDLPAAPAGSYYAAWLRRGPGPGDVIPIGTFHGRRVGEPIVLWSGVDPAVYSTFSVTLQREGELPLPSAPSARRVLVGKVG